jgi:hypothetical protein
MIKWARHVACTMYLKIHKIFQPQNVTGRGYKEQGVDVRILSAFNWLRIFLAALLVLRQNAI